MNRETQFNDDTQPDLMLHVQPISRPLTAADVRQLARSSLLPLYLSDDQVRALAPEILSKLERQCLTIAEQRVRILEVSK